MVTGLPRSPYNATASCSDVSPSGTQREECEQFGLAQTNSGIRLHDHGWQRHALRPATEHLSDEQRQALHRIGPRQRGMTVETASLLADVAV